ncbi:MAG: hypothetical protein ACI8TP_002533 [Acidimicrobiales bacterium]|jgi:hypothetical protein
MAGLDCQLGFARWGHRGWRTGRLAAIGGNAECGTHLVHPSPAERPEAFDHHSDRNRLDRVEIHGAPQRNGVVPRFEHNFAGQAADCGCARRHQCPTQAGNRNVARQHHYWSPANIGRFAPPNLASQRNRAHVADAASRKDPRSPHSSGSAIGCSVYAVS